MTRSRSIGYLIKKYQIDLQKCTNILHTKSLRQSVEKNKKLYQFSHCRMQNVIKVTTDTQYAIWYLHSNPASVISVVN